MAGFYVYNNVGIAFRCFATGVLFGLGSVFFLVYNGLFIGAVAGLVTAAGHGKNLLTFTCTHGAFELTAIVISATAGMVMGYALVDTGGLTRFASLRARARDIAYLVLGAALMLLIAAGIEGFWSPSSVPARVKWGTAIAAYLFVILYLTLAGRRASARWRRRRRRRTREARRVNLLASRVVLRQRSLADVLDLAIPFCLMNKRPLGVLALIVLGPLAGADRRTCASPGTGSGQTCGCSSAAPRSCSKACSPSRWASCCFRQPRNVRVRRHPAPVLPAPARVPGRVRRARRRAGSRRRC